MKFVVAGGGFAGLAAGLAVARAGHEAVVLERDLVGQHDAPEAFTVARRGIPHFFQPHAFLPRGLRELQALAPDVVEALAAAGADPQDVRDRLRGPAAPGDEDLVWFWSGARSSSGRCAVPQRTSRGSICGPAPASPGSFNAAVVQSPSASTMARRSTAT